MKKLVAEARRVVQDAPYNHFPVRLFVVMERDGASLSPRRKRPMLHVDEARPREFTLQAGFDLRASRRSTGLLSTSRRKSCFRQTHLAQTRQDVQLYAVQAERSLRC